jgi:hypothetical protein
MVTMGINGSHAGFTSLCITACEEFAELDRIFIDEITSSRGKE